MAGKTLMSLLVKLGLDTKDFDTGLDKAEGRASKLGVGLAKIGGAAVAGGIAAVGAGVAFMASSIGPASDLNESMNSVNVVFGEAADNIREYGLTAATTVGLSNSAFNQMATTTGAFLQNVGFNADLAGEETIKLTERAADMASVFNTDVATAMGAIQSGLKGEFNPLEQFGVKMNAAQIEAKALSMGLAGNTVDLLAVKDANAKLVKAQIAAEKAVKKYGSGSIEASQAIINLEKAERNLEKAMDGKTDKLTDAMKSQAALALIYEQTSKVQGDFANTSTGLANQQRILSSSFEDLKAQVGTALLPLMSTFTGLITGLASNPAFQTWLAGAVAGIAAFAQSVITWIPQAIAWFQNVITWLTENRGVMIGILAALGVAVVAFAVTAIAAIIPVVTAMLPVIAIMAAVGVAAYLLYQAWTTNWGGIQEKTAAVIAWVKTAVQNVVTVLVGIFNYFKTITLNILSLFSLAFQGKWTEFGQKLRTMWDTAWKNIITILKGAWTAISNAVAAGIVAVIQWFKNTDWPAVGKAIIQGVANGISAGISWLIEAAKSAAKAAYDAAKGFLGIKSPSKLFSAVGLNISRGMAQGILSGRNMIVDAVGDVSVAGVNRADGGSSTNTSTYNFNYSGNATPQQIYQSYEMARTIG